MSDAKRIGRYEIGPLIGKGAGASVFRGTDGEKSVALKLVPATAIAPERLAALRETSRTLARMRHPAMVPFVELIEHDKIVCLVSELARGESLAALMKAGERFDLRRVWEVVRQVLEALEATHAKGIFHGDLKPANIFIDKGQVSLTDFGLANLVPNMGTPEFMAPEQVADGRTDARTDVYQAGALVYLLVTGKPPFSGTREEIVHRVLQERPTDPSQMAAKIAWQLDWVVQRALSKDPIDRFGAAREFMDGLRLGLQESIGAPLPVVKAPAVSDAPAIAPAKAAPAKAAKPAPEAALAQKAKLIAPKPAPEPKPEPPKPAKTRVLFVDDEERILNALRILFRDDYDVVTATSGAAAIEALKANPTQIVVSDQRMPGMAGVEVLREVRKASPRTVRILLTGYSDLAALVGSINEGEVFRFVKKPGDNDEIRAVLKEAAAVAAKVAPPPAEKLQAKKVAASILVIDTDNSLAKGLQRMLGSEVTVHEAVSAAEAAKVLQGSDVAAVVGDLRAGSTGLVSLFKLLKAKRPDTLSIMLSDQPDSEVVADCINQAHVHRFLAKPVNARELQQHVTDALQRYASGFSEGAASLPDRLVPDTA
jgi:serine/threonine-protein kinase